MGKVQYIKKARKQWKCGKCNTLIEVGMSYYKGEINFGPTIVRCTRCKLQPWEVTTSEYSLQVGELVNNWSETYGQGEEALEEISSELENIRDQVQERLDNMPEGCQEGDVGQMMQERIDALESAQSDIDCIDADDAKSSAADSYRSRVVEALVEAGVDEDEAEELADDMGYDEMMDDDRIPQSVKEELGCEFQENLSQEIQDALEQLEY